MPFSPEALAQAASQPGFEEPPPDGDYETSMYKADIFEAKSDGAQYVRLHWRLLAGPLRDHEWASIHAIDDDAPGLGVTAQVLSTIGVDITALAQTPNSTIVDLRKALDRVEGGTYSVEVKTRGQYRNTMPRKTLEQRLADAGPEPEIAPGQTYGQPPPGTSSPPPRNAIFQGDDPPPRSDVPSDGFDAPKKGDIDPETGLPIPF